MSFRGSFVIGQSFEESGPIRQSNANQDYDDVPVILDIEEEEDDQQERIDFLLNNNENFQGVIDPHKSAAFGLRTSMNDQPTSFSREANLLNSGRQRVHTFKQTFGDPDLASYDQIGNNFEKSTEIVATDEDFIFIQEVLQQAASELRIKEFLPQSLPKVLEMESMDDITNTLQNFSQEITCQFQEFQRVIDFGGFLLDQCKKARQETEEAQQQLEEKNREIQELQEREAIILNDWKHEQQCTRELENTLQKREEAYLLLQDKNNRQRVTIDQMARENERISGELAKKQKPITPKATTPTAQEQVKKTFDFKVEKVDPRIEELEQLLLEKADELDRSEKQNEINNQRIQQTIELNEQLYFDIDEANQALIEYEQKILELEKLNQQLVAECQRLEAVNLSQPNKHLMMQSSKNGEICVGENMSQRTQSLYDISQMNHSNRVFDLNDDLVSKKSQLQTMRQTAAQQQKESSPLIKLANSQTLNKKTKQSPSQEDQTPSSSPTKFVSMMQIETGNEEHYDPHDQLEDQLDQQEFGRQDLALIDHSMRESQLQTFQEHFQNQDEIQPAELQYQEIVVNEDEPVVGITDQDGLPADHFSNFDYKKRPSYLISSRISALPLNERPAQNLQISTVDPPVQLPITQRLKTRQDQLKRIIETTDVLEGQAYFEDIRRTFNHGSSSVLIQQPLQGPSQPGTPRPIQDAPKTSRAQNQNKRFDFSQKAIPKLEISPPIVNNTYITNHYNNFPISPTQALKSDEIVQLPQLAKVSSNPATKKIELVDLDHYMPVKKQSTTGLGALSQFVAETNKPQNSLSSKPASSRTSFARLTESMLVSMPVIVEESELRTVKGKDDQQQSLKVLPSRASTTNSAAQASDQRNENRLSTDSFQLKSPVHTSSSVVSSENMVYRRRSVASRKEPEEEFFFMTLVSQIMCHQKKNLIISLQQDSNKLFKLCQKKNKAFFEWPKWISEYLEEELKKMKETSLQKTQRFGAKKIGAAITTNK